MMKTYSFNDYIGLLQTKIEGCASIEEDDRMLPHIYDKTKTEWVIQRDADKDKKGTTLFENNPAASRPMVLREGGQIEFYLRLRQLRQPNNLSKVEKVEIVHYRLTFLDLPKNPNNISSLRYDYSTSQKRGRDWDDDLGDNPGHPQAHVHINFKFTGSDGTANDLRMPTGQVCPILILRAFDYWYCETFLSPQGKKK